MVGLQKNSLVMSDMSDNEVSNTIEEQVFIKDDSKIEEDGGEDILIGKQDGEEELNNLNITTPNNNTKALFNETEKCEDLSSLNDEENEKPKKGILKYQRTYSNKRVGFNMDLEYIPFDETKDYTVFIQIVEQMPKKIVSYAALFEQQRKEEEQQKKEEEEKHAKEAEEKEKLKRKHKAKRRNTLGKKICKNCDKTRHLLYAESSCDKTERTSEIKLEGDDEMNDGDDEEELSENSYLSDEVEGNSDSSELSERKITSDESSSSDQSEDKNFKNPKLLPHELSIATDESNSKAENDNRNIKQVVQCESDNRDEIKHFVTEKTYENENNRDQNSKVQEICKYSTEDYNGKNYLVSMDIIPKSEPSNELGDSPTQLLYEDSAESSSERNDPKLKDIYLKNDHSIESAKSQAKLLYEGSTENSSDENDPKSTEIHPKSKQSNIPCNSPAELLYDSMEKSGDENNSIPKDSYPKSGHSIELGNSPPLLLYEYSTENSSDENDSDPQDLTKINKRLLRSEKDSTKQVLYEGCEKESGASDDSILQEFYENNLGFKDDKDDHSFLLETNKSKKTPSSLFNSSSLHKLNNPQKKERSHSLTDLDFAESLSLSTIQPLPSEIERILSDMLYE